MKPPTFRPYRATDAAILASLYNQGLRHPSQIRLDAEGVRRLWLTHRCFRAQDGSWLAEGPDGSPLGAAHVLFDGPSETAPVPEVRFRFWLLAPAEPLPGPSDLFRALLAKCLSASQLEPRRPGFQYFVGGNAMAGEGWKESLFQTAGLHPARSFVTMRCRGLTTLDSPPTVAGVAIREWEPGLDRATWHAFEEAFRDHWGYQESPYEDFQRIAHGLDSRPDLWRLAIDEVTGEVAGINLVGIPPASGLSGAEGWVHDLAVRRAWRGRGVGYALLLAGMHALRDHGGVTSILLTVDAENPTGALRLYQKAGFEVDYEKLAWELRLDG
jgi:ribosomal protein S18 acetylase RimI-like enzyme